MQLLAQNIMDIKYSFINVYMLHSTVHSDTQLFGCPFVRRLFLLDGLKRYIKKDALGLYGNDLIAVVGIFGHLLQKIPSKNDGMDTILMPYISSSGKLHYITFGL